jgi:hypothetical protein
MTFNDFHQWAWRRGTDAHRKTARFSHSWCDAELNIRAFVCTDPTHGNVNGSSANFIQKYHWIYMNAWHFWDPQDYNELVLDLYWILLPGLWLKKTQYLLNISCFTYDIHTNILLCILQLLQKKVNSIYTLCRPEDDPNERVETCRPMNKYRQSRHRLVPVIAVFWLPFYSIIYVHHHVHRALSLNYPKPDESKPNSQILYYNKCNTDFRQKLSL